MSDNAPETTEASAKPGKFKVLLLMAAIVVAEAVVIVGGMKFLAGPDEVQANPMPDMEMSDDDKIVETLVLSGKLPNSRTGVTYLYDTEVFVQSRQKYAERVTTEMEQFQNEIKADITAIWRTSEPHHFDEPRLETLTRKVYALLNERFGTDPESGDVIAEKAVIVMQTGFRIDA
ncbi:MAG: hypothetical protein AAF432_11690 [Planctomycetota bacterium]